MELNTRAVLGIGWQLMVVVAAWLRQRTINTPFPGRPRTGQRGVA